MLKLQHRLQCMTDDELYYAALTKTVIEIVKSGLANYHTFHSLIQANKNNNVRNLHLNPAFFNHN